MERELRVGDILIYKESDSFYRVCLVFNKDEHSGLAHMLTKKTKVETRAFQMADELHKLPADIYKRSVGYYYWHFVEIGNILGWANTERMNWTKRYAQTQLKMYEPIYWESGLGRQSGMPISVPFLPDL